MSTKGLSRASAYAALRAEALEFACSYLSGEERKRSMMMTQEEIGQLLMQARTATVTLHARLEPERYRKAVNELVVAAKKDPIAFDSAREVAAQAIESKLEISPDLAEFVAGVLREKSERPKRARGPAAHRSSLRKLYLAMAAHKLLERYGARGLKLNRNAASDHEDSIFDIVADAARRAGIRGATYAGVREAYREWA